MVDLGHRLCKTSFNSGLSLPCFSPPVQAENEMYDRKLDVDNEQTEQVDEKKKSSPLTFLTEMNRLLFAEVECLPFDTFVRFCKPRSRMDFFQELHYAWPLVFIQ